METQWSCQLVRQEARDVTSLCCHQCWDGHFGDVAAFEVPRSLLHLARLGRIIPLDNLSGVNRVGSYFPRESHKTVGT